MPAIDIARLKIQAAALVENFDQPDVFLKNLHEILDLYADRTLRIGVVSAPITVIPSYRVHQSVLRQIEQELLPLASTFPEPAMALTDSLWKDGYLETRLLAAALLGRINPSTPLLLDRVSAWVSRARDKTLRNALLGNSLGRLRHETPEQFLNLMKEWLSPDWPKMWPNAILAILPLIQDPAYDNLPPVYDLIKPIIENPPTTLQLEISELINALYIASPKETTFYLKQILLLSQNSHTLLFFRRALPAINDELREPMREWLRSAQKANKA